MNNFNFLTEDWKKIPKNYRFLILVGSFMIFNSWLLDHWGTNRIYTLWGLDIREPFYSLGLSLILICFLMIVSKQFWSFYRTEYLRRRYSLNKFGKTFNLVAFSNDVLILFDYENKKYFNVATNNETMNDLSFADLAFYPHPLPFDLELHNLAEFPIGRDAKMIKMSEYKHGGIINTKN